MNNSGIYFKEVCVFGIEALKLIKKAYQNSIYFERCLERVENRFLFKFLKSNIERFLIGKNSN